LKPVCNGIDKHKILQDVRAAEQEAGRRELRRAEANSTPTKECQEDRRLVGLWPPLKAQGQEDQEQT